MAPGKCPYSGTFALTQPSRTSGPARRLQAVATHVVGGMVEPPEGDVTLDTLRLTPFESMPHLPGEDMTSYRTGNHWYICDLHERYGDIFRLQRDSKPVVFVRSAESVRKVLLEEDDFSKTFDADDVSTGFLQYLMNIMQPLLKEAEVFGSQDNKKQRAMLKKTFMSSPEFLPGFAAAVDRALDRWPKEGRFDVLMASHLLVFEAVMVTIMGENTSYLSDFQDESIRVLRYFEQRYSKPMFDMPINAEDEAVMARLNDKGLEVVQEFKRRVAAGTQVLPGQSVECFERSMLAQLVKDSSMSDEEMTATMINTLLAASEGPAAGLSRMLIELADNTSVQARLAQELAAGEERDPARFQELPYLKGCVLEGLRLFSPVTLVQRFAIRDTVLDGIMIPKGTICAVCVAAVHRDEKQFVDSREFDPTRDGLDYHMLQRDACFMTFSGGPRGCPGKHLAVTILKQALAKTVERFELQPTWQPTDIPGKVYKFVDWNVGGLFVNLAPRS